MIVMNENIVFLNIINREGQLILKNEQYIKKTIATCFYILLENTFSDFF